MDNEKFQELVLQQLKTLNGGQQQLQNDFSKLHEGQQELRSDFSKQETRFENKLKEVQQELQGSITKLEIRMENEVIDKIRILFDAWQVHEDKFDQVMDKLKDVSTDVRYLVTRIARLEKIAK